MIDLDLRGRVLYKRSDVGEGEVDGALLLFSATDRRLHQLNASASAIWRAVDAHRTASDVVEAVAAEYAVESPAIEHDVFDVLLRLREGGLLLDEHDQARPQPADQRSSVAPPAPDSIRIGPVHALDTALFIDIDLVSDDAAALHALLQSALSPILGEDAGALDLDGPLRQVALLEARHRDEGWTIIRDDDEVASRCSNDRAVRTLLAELNALALDGVTDALVFHAAGIEFPSGIVMFPGFSNAGKSTLAAQLLERGHGYLTDEATAVTATGDARSFHKSLCLERGAQMILGHLEPTHGATAGVWDVDPRVIGPGRLCEGGPLSAVVFPRFSHAAELSFRPIGAIEAVERLLENAFDFEHLGASAFERLSSLATSVPCFALDHGGQADVMRTLEAKFGSVS